MWTELRDTENAHKKATEELEQMREMMDRMEEERAEMVAEVEAQIERALTSMAVDFDDSDYASSRPVSRLSNISGTRSRRASDAAKSRHLRSFPTDSTLAESYGELMDSADAEGLGAPEKTVRQTETIVEDDEEEPVARRKRFSASEMDAPQDSMNAVDEGITQKSDKIAQKVLEIQQKVSVPSTLLSKLAKRILQLESAMASERRTPKYHRTHSAQGSGEEDLSEVSSTRSRPSRSRRSQPKHAAKPASRPRTRSSTMSSTQTSIPTVKSAESDHLSSVSKSRKVLSAESDAQTPTRASFLDVSGDDTSTPEAVATPVVEELTLAKTAVPASKGSAPVGLTDDSDTDFQSAYSASPRQSYGSFDGKHPNGDIENTETAAVVDDSIENRLSAPPRMRRERVTSTSIATPTNATD